MYWLCLGRPDIVLLKAIMPTKGNAMVRGGMSLWFTGYGRNSKKATPPIAKANMAIPWIMD